MPSMMPSMKSRRSALLGLGLGSAGSGSWACLMYPSLSDGFFSTGSKIILFAISSIAGASGRGSSAISTFSLGLLTCFFLDKEGLKGLIGVSVVYS